MLFTFQATSQNISQCRLIVEAPNRKKAIELMREIQGQRAEMALIKQEPGTMNDLLGSDYSTRAQSRWRNRHELSWKRRHKTGEEPPSFVS